MTPTSWPHPVVVLYQGTPRTALQTYREARQAAAAGSRIIRCWMASAEYQDVTDPVVVAAVQGMVTR